MAIVVEPPHGEAEIIVVEPPHDEAEVIVVEPPNIEAEVIAVDSDSGDDGDDEWRPNEGFPRQRLCAHN